MRLSIQGACQRRKPFYDADSARSHRATGLGGRKKLPSSRYILRDVRSVPTTLVQSADDASTQRGMLRDAQMPILANPNEDNTVNHHPLILTRLVLLSWRSCPCFR